MVQDKVLTLHQISDGATNKVDVFDYTLESKDSQDKLIREINDEYERWKDILSTDYLKFKFLNNK